MSVTTRVDAEKKRVVINISGKFDFSLHQQFREAYRDRTERGFRFELNLSEANYMDSSALGMVLLLKEHAEKQGSQVVITRPGESIRKILKIANFDKLVPIEG
ncbi:MAG: anti-anti-sigma factor [Oceanospirillaceae bacterium]|nr:anti-anti-sigma factor [Oceanospirillaceae bacterium]